MGKPPFQIIICWNGRGFWLNAGGLGRASLALSYQLPPTPRGALLLRYGIARSSLSRKQDKCCQRLSFYKVCLLAGCILRKAGEACRTSTETVIVAAHTFVQKTRHRIWSGSRTRETLVFSQLLYHLAIRIGCCWCLSLFSRCRYGGANGSDRPRDRPCLPGRRGDDQTSVLLWASLQDTFSKHAGFEPAAPRS